MPRPTEIPGWGGTTTPSPTAGEQTAGWSFEDRPPYQWMNWFWNLLSGWVDHFNTRINGAASVNYRPGFEQVGTTLGAGGIDRTLLGWTQAAGGGFQTPAGATAYLETSAINNHQMNLVLNGLPPFTEALDGDAIRIDSIDIDHELLAGDSINVVITGSSSGTVFSETTATGPTGRTTENLVESLGAPDLDPTAETWTLIVSGFPTGANDIRVYDIDVNYTVVTP